MIVIKSIAEEKREIRMVEDVSPLTAMTRLLETLDQKENIPGKWQAFKDALRENGIVLILKLLYKYFSLILCVLERNSTCL